MNVVTFNQPFEAMVRSICASKWKEWSVSPLFDHALNVDKSIDQWDALIRDGTEQIPVPPFPMFRLALNIEYKQDTDPVEFFVRATAELEWEIFVRPKGFFQRMGRSRGVEGLMMARILVDFNVGGKIKLYVWDMRRTRWLDPTSEKDIKIASYNLDGREENIPITNLQDDHDALLKQASQWAGCVATFMLDASSPQNHVATVHPNQEHRSVEWKRSRTHYTLISHGHPANRKEVASGESVSVDRNEEITRMAHNRRAHWRTYKHERYRFARGSRRLVRATWVGPKEWKDQGGRQIYKILDPVETEAVAA
jgi:hypothetical protein